MKKKGRNLSIIIVMIFAVITLLVILQREPAYKVPKEVHNDKSSAYSITNDVPPKEQHITIRIIETTMKLEGKKVKRYMYTDKEGSEYKAGLPIILSKNGHVTLTIYNETSAITNLHWHGVHVPIDQDGPEVEIHPNEKYVYSFETKESGTYWYHAHVWPVRDQVDYGMYGAFIVKNNEDTKYAHDQIYVLDDWEVKQLRKKEKHTAHGEHGDDEEKIGNVDTVNGEAFDGIKKLHIQTGELSKLRFINASTARTQIMKFPVDVRVTHKDGFPLTTPYITREITIAPAERYDVELQVMEKSSKTMAIRNDRKKGIEIPIVYKKTNHQKDKSPFVPKVKQQISQKIQDKKPDFIIDLSAEMKKNKVVWEMNGKAFPNTDMYNVQVGKEYKFQFRVPESIDTIDHPLHIHGTHFRILAVNGIPEKKEIWADTTIVPAKGTVDILVKFDKPGMWMMHCHILDHEDAGMMTMIHAH